MTLEEVRFARGEQSAFVAAYRRHGQAVQRWVRRFFSSPFEQEEAVQEVWLTAHRMHAAYEPARGDLSVWLRALTANRCRELWRQRGRRPTADVPIDDVSDALWLDAPGPDDGAFAKTLNAELTRFAASLPDDEARVLELSLVQQRTHPEVALALGIDERRAKYLKMKVLAAASRDGALRALMQELK